MFGNSIIFQVIFSSIFILVIVVLIYVFILNIRGLIKNRKNINENHNNTIENENIAMKAGNEEMARINNEASIDDAIRASEEGLKSVTPFEHGGYDVTQGNSFNDMNNML